MNDNITYMTIQERIERTKKSMAFSPFDAARKVLNISDTMSSELTDFAEYSDFPESEAKNGDVRNVPYGKFCSHFKDNVCKELNNSDKIPYKPRFGILNSDLIYLIASDIAALPDNKSPKSKKPRIYRDLLMTLGDYLDALIDISFSKEKGMTCKSRADEYRKLKKEFSELIDLSTPLCKAIDIILEQYSQNRRELNRLDNIISYCNELKFDLQMREMRSEYLDYDSCYDYDDDEDEDDEYEEEITEADEAQTDEPVPGTVQIDEEGLDEIEYDESSVEPAAFVMDEDEKDIFDEPADMEEYMRIKAEESYREMYPFEYYLSKAKGLPSMTTYAYLSSEEKSEMSKEYPNILLIDDFSPEALKAKADSAELYPQFQKLVEETVTEESVSSAIKDMDDAADKLYRLLILPFAGIDEFTFDHHLTDEE